MNRAFVTLLTSESYLPGALVLLRSLKKYSPSINVFIVSTLDKGSKADLLLESQFDRVIRVSPIIGDQAHKDNLDVLERPDLNHTLTKLHVFNIDNVDQIVYLDCDVLVLGKIEELFSFVDDALFAAAPDIGWPDCFNSGVFATRPSQSLFLSLLEFSKSNTSFDGGDQGLLNSFFSTWSRNDPQVARIPFVYNVTPSTFYSYLPAFNHFANDLKCVHFIGRSKPWKWNRRSDGSLVPQGHATPQTMELVEKWWKVFDEFNIAQLLHGFILDRDWSKYTSLANSLKASSSNAGAAFASSFMTSHDPIKDLSTDLEKYNIGWNEAELGPYRNKSSVSPTSTTFRKSSITSISSASATDDRKKYVSDHGIVFSSTKPPSPTKTKQALPLNADDSSTRNATQRTSPVVDEALSSPDSPKKPATWNEKELKTGQSSNDQGKNTKASDSVAPRPAVRTDSFTISQTGTIKYK